MTTIINANNSGITQTVDTSGVLQIQTANTAAITIDTSQNITCNSTGAIIVSSGTTAQRPASPANGMLRYNTTLACFEVYANNTWALSNVTPPPTNTVAPAISGAAVVGTTLSTTDGTWTYNPTSYSYQWLANTVAIVSNATSNTFVLTSTQLGANITCNVTANNGAGPSTPATSNAIGPVITQYTINYLVIAGGGGGGSDSVNGWGSGGGGAGGLLTNSFVTSIGVVYTATVGGGGSQDSFGTNSSLSGSGLSTVTCIGGGRGGSVNSGASGGNGGSGGGGRGQGGGTAGGSGTAGQGNNGGNGTNGSPYTGGGGGGAGGAGGTPGGGSSTNSSITGSSVAYAGGGGGGQFNGGGGSGGGGGAGNGGSGGSAGSASANTGSGGGGAGSTAGAGGNGGAGGSGVIILSMPTASYSGTTTGSPTVTTSGSNTILKFTQSGTYTS